MVHADSSTFSAGLTKAQAYRQVLEQASALFEGQRNWHLRNFRGRRTLNPPARSNLANTSSLLYHALLALPPPSSAVNWCGFYTNDPKDVERLILGPFHGNVACQTIAVGKGVCGTAAKTGKTQLVRDVEAFPGHIACDGATKSEIVVPIVQADKVVGVIDIDCAYEDGFDEEDKKYLQQLAKLLARSCDF